MRFSVLIPVYNSGKYLRECLQSVWQQSYQEFELILVDDGSTDDSSTICDRAAREDPRVRVLHQENQGPLMARIAALQEAVGEYVIYMDSDDCWREDLLEQIDKILQKDDCDVVSFKWRYMSQDGELLDEEFSAHTEVMKKQPIELVIKWFLGTEYENSLWKRAVRRDRIDQKEIAVLSEVRDIYMGEDMIQAFVMLKNCRNMIYIDEPLYYYRETPGSITTGAKSDLMVVVANARNYLRGLLIQSNFGTPEYLDLFDRNFLEHYLTDLACTAMETDIRRLKDAAERVRRLDIYQAAVKKAERYQFPMRRRLLLYLEYYRLWGCYWILSRLFQIIQNGKKGMHAGGQEKQHRT